MLGFMATANRVKGLGFRVSGFGFKFSGRLNLKAFLCKLIR